MLLTRNGFLTLAACSLAACSPAGPAEPPKLVHGGWKLEATAVKPATEAPESIASLKPVRILDTTYIGPQDIQARWIEFSNDTVAFEAMQKLRKTPEFMAFNRGPFLILLTRGDLPSQALGDFAEGVGKAIR
jgi:hypothetical protein